MYLGISLFCLYFWRIGVLVLEFVVDSFLFSMMNLSFRCFWPPLCQMTNLFCWLHTHTHTPHHTSRGIFHLLLSRFCFCLSAVWFCCILAWLSSYLSYPGLLNDLEIQVKVFHQIWETFPFFLLLQIFFLLLSLFSFGDSHYQCLGVLYVF